MLQVNFEQIKISKWIYVNCSHYKRVNKIATHTNQTHIYMYKSMYT